MLDLGAILAVLQTAGSLLSHIVKYANEVKGAATEISRLQQPIQELEAALKQLHEVCRQHPGRLDGCTIAVTTAQTELSSLDVLLNKHTSSRRSRLGLHYLLWPSVKKDVDGYVKRLEQNKTTILLALKPDQLTLAFKTDSHAEKAEQDRLLAKLRPAEHAAFNSFDLQHKARCLDNTRTELLREVEAWSSNHEQKPIFWLSGMAGSGKSTIARTLAHRFKQQDRLGASFFFARGDGDLGNARAFVGTLACQLATVLPAIRDHVCQVLSEEPALRQQGLRIQWRELVVASLAKLETQSNQINLVIDALDECDGYDNVKTILQLLVDIVKIQGVGIFITSRPETPIRHGFRDMPLTLHKDLILDDVDPNQVNRDIALYLRNELEKVRIDFDLTNWPGDKAIEMLVRKADRLFIYAATVCLEVGKTDWDPEERLTEFLSDADNSLDDIYTQVLEHALTKSRAPQEAMKLTDRFKLIIGTTVTGFDSFSPTTLAKLLNLTIGKVNACLSPLYAVLSLSKSPHHPIRLVHPSFRDYLLDCTRCQSDLLWINKLQAHQRMVNTCLDHIAHGLKQDICDLRLPASRTDEVDVETLDACLPPHIRYAILYWVDHLACVYTLDQTQLGPLIAERVRNFFLKDFLHWLEAMSLIGRLTESVNLVNRLRENFKISQDPVLRDLIYDAWRFLLKARAYIDEFPLQIYYSAVPFAPRNSIIRKAYEDRCTGVVQSNTISKPDWDRELQHFDLGNDGALCISFVADDSLLAVATYQGSLLTFEIATGALLNRSSCFLDEDNRSFIRACFSVDGTQLAALEKSSEQISIWDTVSGAFRVSLRLGPWPPAKFPPPQVGVEFASDDRLIFTSIYDKSHPLTIIRASDLSDPDKWYQVEIQTGDFGPCHFHRGGELLVTTFRPTTILSWDPRGDVLNVIYDGADLSEAYSAILDGDNLLIFKSAKEHVVFDVDERKIVSRLPSVKPTFLSLPGYIWTMDFDSQRLEVWDLEKSTLTSSMEFPTSYLKNVSISTDRQLVVASDTMVTIKLFSMAQDYPSRSGSATSSHYARLFPIFGSLRVPGYSGRIFGGYEHLTIADYDMENYLVTELPGFTYVEWKTSPDSCYLVGLDRRLEVAENGPIYIYHVATRVQRCIWPLGKEPEQFNRRAPPTKRDSSFEIKERIDLVISSDNQLALIYKSNSHEDPSKIVGHDIRLWHLSTLHRIETPLMAGEPFVCRPAISADSRFIALGFGSGLVKIRKVQTLDKCQVLQVQASPVGLAFLPNKVEIVILEGPLHLIPKKVTVWNFQQCEQVYTLNLDLMLYQPPACFSQVGSSTAESSITWVAGYFRAFVWNADQARATGRARVTRVVPIVSLNSSNNCVSITGSVLHCPNGALALYENAKPGCWYLHEEWILLDGIRMLRLPSEIRWTWRVFNFIDPVFYFRPRDDNGTLRCIELDTGNGLDVMTRAREKAS